LRGIFGPKKQEVARGWRRQQNEELHNLYSSPSIVREIKLSRTRRMGHVARMREMRSAYNIVLEILKGRHHSEDLSIDGWIIIEWILGK
jgi:hypothetical protein